MVKTTTYETDFYSWTQDQAALLRSGASDLDRQNLAEEIESLGRSERREVESRLIVLLTHLIKWEYQSDRRSRSWANTIRMQRRDLERVLRDSPSLRAFAEVEALNRAFPRAVEVAEDEMQLIQPLVGIKPRTFESVMTEKIDLL